VGLAGTELSTSEHRALASGTRGGAVLFRRNLTPGLEGAERLVQLARAIRDAAPSDLPPLVAIDQEGGRVVRIGPPALALPPMRPLGARGDEAFPEGLAEPQAGEPPPLGTPMSFAPTADIHTRPENPIIGDRAFAETADGVIRFARAWARGLARGGV